MRIAFAADLHLRGKDLAITEWHLAELSEKLRANADILLVAGDVFDHPQVGDRHASTGAITRVINRFLRNLSIPVVLIPGNHDKANEASVDALAVLEATDPQITVVREAQWVYWPGTVTPWDPQPKPLAVACLPWFWDGDASRHLALLAEEAVPAADYTRVLIAHVQVKGAVMNGGRRCQEGSFSVSMQELTDFPAERIALGDFHQRQTVAGEKGGYVGAIRQLNFGEEGNPQGFEIWDSVTNEVQWIELETAPKFTSVEWERGEIAPELEATSYNRVVVNGWIPEAGSMTELQEAGVRIDVQAVHAPRMQRTEGELPDNDPVALFMFWMTSLTDQTINDTDLLTELSELLAA